MEITGQCRYCAHIFKKEVYSRLGEYWLICPKCGDKDIKVIKDVDMGDVFGYNKTNPDEDAYIKKKKNKQDEHT